SAPAEWRWDRERRRVVDADDRRGSDADEGRRDRDRREPARDGPPAAGERAGPRPGAGHPGGADRGAGGHLRGHAMSADAPAHAGIAELGRLFRRKEVSPVELVRTLLARIERLEPTLHCVVTLTVERALAEAQAAEARPPRGGASPRFGIPVGHKALHATRGVPTTARP